MNRSSLAIAFVAALALGPLAAAAPAQVSEGKPIVIKQPKAKTLKFKGIMIAATPVQITVRDINHERIVRTFSLTTDMQKKMRDIIDRGGWQNGDAVEIHFKEGTEVAHKIKGKPSGVK